MWCVGAPAGSPRDAGDPALRAVRDDPLIGFLSTLKGRPVHSVSIPGNAGAVALMIRDLVETNAVVLLPQTIVGFLPTAWRSHTAMR